MLPLFRRALFRHCPPAPAPGLGERWWVRLPDGRSLRKARVGALTRRTVELHEERLDDLVVVRRYARDDVDFIEEAAP